MDALPTLDIAISTYRPEGISRVASMELPRLEGVRYVVSWQAHEGAPVPDTLKDRYDVIVCRFGQSGQSKNRNNALDHCAADIIVCSDDDVTFFPDGIQSLRRAFAENPEVDFATFRSVHGDMSRFPAESVRLTLPYPKGYHASGIELAMRRSKTGSLRFCPEFGLNSPRLHGGEDEMLLLSAIRRGLECRYFPITVCSHPHESTGTAVRLSDANLRASGAVIALTTPATAVLRLPLKAWRLHSSGQSGFFRALRHLFSGALSSRAVLRRNHDTLW